MSNNKQIPPAEEKTAEELADECRELLEKLRATLSGAKPLSAPKIYEEIVRIAIAAKMDLTLCEEGAKMLADFAKEATIFKRRKFTEKISRIDLPSTVLFLRASTRVLEAGISLDACLTKHNYKGRMHSGFVLFKKRKLRTPVVYGNNKFGQLGVGPEQPMVSSFTEIAFGTKENQMNVKEIFIGSHHSIFRMQSGEYYACGKAINFIEDEKDPNKIISTPVRLEYLEYAAQKSKVPLNVILTANSTRFVSHQTTGDLLIGSVDPEMHGLISHRPGSNVAIIPSENLITRKKREDFHRKISLANLKGQVVPVVIQTDGFWRLDSGQFPSLHPISFFVCGKNVEADLLWKSFHVCGPGPNEGVIYARHGRTLYRGTLMFAPRARQDDVRASDEMSDDPSDDECETAVLVAMMEEMALPMRVEWFGASEDGTSLIFLPKDASPRKIREHLPQIVSRAIWTYSRLEEPLNCDYCLYTNELLNLRLTAALERFSEWKPDWKAWIFHTTGLAVDGVPFLQVFKTIHIMLYSEEEKEAPEVLEKIWCKNDEKCVELLDAELMDVFNTRARAPSLVVQTEYAYGKNPDEKAKQMRQKGVEFFDEHLFQIRRALEKFARLPLKYNCRGLTNRFGYHIFHLIGQLEEAFKNLRKIPRTTLYIKPFESTFRADLVEVSARDRLEKGDITENDKMFELIRVEAVGVRQKVQEGPVEHFPFSIRTTRFFIEAIDPQLMGQVKDGVLNLNNVCLFDESDVRFHSFLDAFFHVKNDEERVRREFNKPISVCDLLSSVPEEDLYEITVLDISNYVEDEGREEGNMTDVSYTVCRFPKALFQLFSDGYDAGRRRNAELKGTNPDKFSLPFRAETLNAVIQVLYDIRYLFNFDMKMKKEIYEVCMYCIFSAAIPDVLQMIVRTAVEEDVGYINRLFEQHPEKMALMVGEHRPDILLYWKSFQISSMEMLKNICEFTKAKCYKEYTNIGAQQKLLLRSHPDKMVDHERADHQWLLNRLSDEDKDKDVRWELTRTLFLWDGWRPDPNSRGYNTGARRRRREASDTPQDFV